MGHVTLTTPVRGQFVIQWPTLDIVYLYSEFDNSSFSCSRDTIGWQKMKWVMWSDHAPLCVVCYPWTRTGYDKPIYLLQIWSLYLHPLQRYERRYKMSKLCWFILGHPSCIWCPLLGLTPSYFAEVFSIRKLKGVLGYCAVLLAWSRV